MYSRDPDHGMSDRYTSRFLLKHVSLEQAFDTLLEANFKLVGASSYGANETVGKESKQCGDFNEENRCCQYSEYVFMRFE